MPANVSAGKDVSMAIARYIVDDVNVSLPFYEALGFVLADRWGPPFAIVERSECAR